MMLLLCCTLTPATLVAQTYSLGGIVQRLQSAELAVGFATTNPAVDKRLAGLGQYFADVHASDLTLDDIADIITRRSLDLGTIARWDRRAVDAYTTRPFRDSITSLTTVAHGTLEAALQAKLSKRELDSLYKPIDSLGTLVLVLAKANNQDKLRRFEIKYGAASPQLNVAEVGLNYLAQLALPGFLPSSDGYPTPYEIVASYRTTDLTAAQSTAGHLTARVVSTAQLGLRIYDFKEGCGKGSRFADLLNPCQSSLGAFFLPADDAALRRVFGKGSRSGFFLARGKYHVGYVFGDQQRFVFGMDQQIVPYMF
ncbi:MAG: hypothetical protein ABJE47_09995 [bacterium]